MDFAGSSANCPYPSLLLSSRRVTIPPTLILQEKAPSTPPSASLGGPRAELAKSTSQVPGFSVIRATSCHVPSEGTVVSTTPSIEMFPAAPAGPRCRRRSRARWPPAGAPAAPVLPGGPCTPDRRPAGRSPGRPAAIPTHRLLAGRAPFACLDIDDPGERRPLVDAGGDLACAGRRKAARATPEPPITTAAVTPSTNPVKPRPIRGVESARMGPPYDDDQCYPPEHHRRTALVRIAPTDREDSRSNWAARLERVTSCAGPVEPAGLAMVALWGGGAQLLGQVQRRWPR